MVLDDKTYKVAKYVTNIVLPAIATLYLAISGVLVQGGLPGLPYPDVVAGVITAVVTFLGTILHISSNNYTGQGELTVDESKNEDDEDKYRLVLHEDLPSLAKNDKFVVTVNKTQN